MQNLLKLAADLYLKKLCECFGFERVEGVWDGDDLDVGREVRLNSDCYYHLLDPRLDLQTLNPLQILLVVHHCDHSTRMPRLLSHVELIALLAELLRFTE